MSKNTAGPTFFPPLGPAKVSGGIKPDGWDLATLAGRVVPGYSTVTRGGVRLKIDHKKKSGSDGTNPTAHGIDPQPLELEVVTYTDDDREDLASLMRSVAPQQGKTPQPVSFDHPSTRALGISDVFVTGVTALIPVSPGVAKCTFELLHWERPKTTKSATTTPTRAINNVRKLAQQAQTAGQATASAVKGFLQNLHVIGK